MAKRLLWKTMYLSTEEHRALQAAWHNSKESLCGGRVYVFDLQSIGGGGGMFETNLPLKALRALFRFAGVPWREWDLLRDSKPSWEYEEDE